jgi:hypothetical protein
MSIIKLLNSTINTNFLDGGQPDIKAIGVGDLSAGCKFIRFSLISGRVPLMMISY